MDATDSLDFDVVVIGGGVAGVTCVENLLLLDTSLKIALVSATNCVKSTTNVVSMGQFMEKFDVIEQDKCEFQQRFPTVTFIFGKANHFNSEQKIVYVIENINTGSCKNNSREFLTLSYKRLCVCTGGEPNLVLPVNSDLIIGIRDVDSVEVLREKLREAKHVAVVGNGGIATEFVFEVDNCHLSWIIKDNHINSAFLDPGASEFFVTQLSKAKKKRTTDSEARYVKRWKYDLFPSDSSGDATFSSTSEQTSEVKVKGPALGPDWHRELFLSGSMDGAENVSIKYNTTIENVEEVICHNFEKDLIEKEKRCLRIKLSNEEVFDCDFLVSATGVNPATEFFRNCEIEIASDGGLLINENFETSIEHVFAAGDCCTPGWDYGPYWLHMRLWTQAKQMGACVARNIHASLQDPPDVIPLDICFEVFTHVTTFFGYKVILLGNFNGKDLNKNECEILMRVTKEDEYLKVLLHNNKMCGAILIGETDYEETFENLIMNGFDLEFIKDQLLDADIDIEDYFD